MLGACRSVYVRRQLAEYRIHARRMSATMADLIRERDDLYACAAVIFSPFLSICNHTPVTMNSLLGRLGYRDLVSGILNSCSPQKKNKGRKGWGGGTS
jgi:hypothetical protein